MKATIEKIIKHERIIIFCLLLFASLAIKIDATNKSGADFLLITKGEYMIQFAFFSAFFVTALLVPVLEEFIFRYWLSFKKWGVFKFATLSTYLLIMTDYIVYNSFLLDSMPVGDSIESWLTSFISLFDKNIVRTIYYNDIIITVVTYTLLIPVFSLIYFLSTKFKLFRKIKLPQSIKSKWFTILIVILNGILFQLLHLPIRGMIETNTLNLDTEFILMYVGDMFAILLFPFVRIRYGIIASILYHIAWNSDSALVYLADTKIEANIVSYLLAILAVIAYTLLWIKLTQQIKTKHKTLNNHTHSNFALKIS